jgi:hypothetical protein
MLNGLRVIVIHLRGPGTRKKSGRPGVTRDSMGLDRGHDEEERMQSQEDRVGEIVALSEMEADEEVGF